MPHMMIKAPSGLCMDSKLAQLRAAWTGCIRCLCRTGQAWARCKLYCSHKQGTLGRPSRRASPSAMQRFGAV